MKNKILNLGFVEYPKYSTQGWTCYRWHKFLWIFINDEDTVIKAEPEDRISFSVDEIEDLQNWMKSKP